MKTTILTDRPTNIVKIGIKVLYQYKHLVMVQNKQISVYSFFVGTSINNSLFNLN